ncbi:MAG: hypothetical protein PVG66_10255 [Chromatiales bacterium]
MEDNSKNSVDEQEKAGIEPVSETRRKLTKAGLVATPIIATLSARRAVAGGGKSGGGGNVMCMSQMLSGNASDVKESCNLGKSPGYWGQHPDKWYCYYKPVGSDPIKPVADHDGPFGYSLDCGDCKKRVYNKWVWDSSKCSGTKFNEVFVGSSESRSIYQILCECNSDQNCTQVPNNLSFLFCAAILNAYNIQNYVMTASQVVDLYFDTSTSGADKDAFLNSTWD